MSKTQFTEPRSYATVLNKTVDAFANMVKIGIALLAVIALFASSAVAQLAGKGEIKGTVTDPTGAVVSNATVVATSTSRGLQFTATSGGSGEFTIPALDPDIYSLTVSASGFKSVTQQNVHVNALETADVPVALEVGSSSETVTVEAAPPQLETSNATLGATMENDLYSALPIEMGAYGQPDQRRATDFAFLMPGVQGNNTSGNATTNTGIVNGSGSRGAVSVVYIDGVAFVRAGGNGDPRYVWTAISVDAVDQFQLQTSGYSAIYEGQGIQNYTVKQGGNRYHGSLYEFFRNTALDTYGWLHATDPVTKQVIKPIEHNNEFGINLSGPLVPFGGWRDKLFFFGNYNSFRYASQTPTAMTFPTYAQQAGDFSAGGANIYDPTTQASCTAHNGGQPCRYQFGFGPGSATAWNKTNPGNGVQTGPINVIPQSSWSQLSLNMQQYQPKTGINPDITVTQNNYISPNRTGLTNWSTTERIDYLITPKHFLTLTAAIGRQASSNPVGQTTSGRNVGPIPYNYGQTYAPKTAVGIIEETYTITPHLLNQIKYGYARYNGPTFDADQLPAYAATKLGFTGLPAGAASEAFPITTFAGTNPATQWAGTGPGVTIAQNYTLVDNVQWNKGRHSLTFGGQIGWMLYNVTSATGGTTPITVANAVAETANIAQPSSATATPTYTAAGSTGLAYASFLLGDYDKVSFTQYSVQKIGTRFRAISPYVQDNWKVTNKLTLDLGLRWDYWPTLTEVHDNMSYFDPNLQFTLPGSTTSLKGGLQFTGTGTGTCNCRTPVNNYLGHFGPRIGAAYQVNPTTVVRASWGLMFTHGNGVGGGTSSLGSLGFSAAPSTGPNGNLQASAGPFNGAFPAYAQALGRASGPSFNIIGNTNIANFTTTSPASAGYADPYLGSRAPEYVNYTFGIQHQWSNAFTTTVTYVGSQGHFLGADGSNARGYWANQLDPKYQSLGTNLALTGTALQTYCANNAGICPSNYSITGSTVSLGTLLKPFPFQGVSDTFGTVANSNYNSIQVQANYRASHGLTFMTNYTWSHSIDDAGTFRTGYAIPAGAVFNNPNAYTADRIERSSSTSNQPQHLAVTGVYALPFGGSILNSNAVERAILGGFKFSGILQAFSGSPLAVTGSACPTNPAQSTCLPYLNPGFTGSARVNGKYGSSTLSGNPTAVSYIAASTCSTTTAVSGPFVNPVAPTGQTSCLNTAVAPSYTLANSARTGQYGLTGPGNYQLDFSLSRSFPLHFTEAAKLDFRADYFNVTNKTFFAVASSQVGNSAFGTVSTSGNYNRRALQLSGRFNF
jgi:hypothetical protein